MCVFYLILHLINDSIHPLDWASVNAEDVLRGVLCCDAMCRPTQHSQDSEINKEGILRDCIFGRLFPDGVRDGKKCSGCCASMTAASLSVCVCGEGYEVVYASDLAGSYCTSC